MVITKVFLLVPENSLWPSLTVRSLKLSSSLVLLGCTEYFIIFQSFRFTKCNIRVPRSPNLYESTNVTSGFRPLKGRSTRTMTLHKMCYQESKSLGIMLFRFVRFKNRHFGCQISPNNEVMDKFSFFKCHFYLNMSQVIKRIKGFLK